MGRVKQTKIPSLANSEKQGKQPQPESEPNTDQTQDALANKALGTSNGSTSTPTATKSPRKHIASKEAQQKLKGGGLRTGEKEKKEKKPHRFRPGTVALREIRKYQKSTDLLIRRLPFQRLCREIANEIGLLEEGVRFRSEALGALQEGAEAYMIHLLDQCNLSALHAHRVTIMGKDMTFVRELEKRNKGVN